MKNLLQKEGIPQSLRKRTLLSGCGSCPAGASDHQQKSHCQMDLPLKFQKKVWWLQTVCIFDLTINERLANDTDYKITAFLNHNTHTKTYQRSLQMDLVHRKIPWRHHLDCGMWTQSGHRCSVFPHLLFKCNTFKLSGQWHETAALWSSQWTIYNVIKHSISQIHCSILITSASW